MREVKTAFRDQRGVAAIFVVIFFALLIGIITLSFATIVNQDQRQSTNNDLAQSAYDSAQAGTEDSKRLLTAYYKCLKSGSCPNQNVYEAAFNTNDCKSILAAANSNLIKPGNATITAGNPDIPVQSNQGGSLEQAYTCVNIKTKTPDYQASLRANQSRVVQLKAVGEYNTATVSWFLADDDAGSGSDNFTYPTVENPLKLPSNASDWGANTPSLLRVQVMPVKKGEPINPTKVSDDSRVIFLYPVVGGGASIDVNTQDQGRRFSKNFAPTQAAGCVNSKSARASGFACIISLTNFNSSLYDYYLRLTPLYNKSHVNVALKSGGATGSTVLFDNVQPTVDSTGRANDVYRRTFTRLSPINLSEVNFNSDFSSTDSICKDYIVGGTEADFAPGSCN